MAPWCSCDSKSGFFARLDSQRPQTARPLAAPQCLAVPTTGRASGTAGLSLPAAKTESKYGGRRSLNFLRRKFAEIWWQLCEDSVLLCTRARWGFRRRGHRAAEPGPRRNARKGASPSLYLANSSAPVRKIVSRVQQTPRMYLWGVAPGRNWLCKSCIKSFAQKRPSSRAQESQGPSQLPRGGMARHWLGEPPLLSSLPSL